MNEATSISLQQVISHELGRHYQVIPDSFHEGRLQLTAGDNNPMLPALIAEELELISGYAINISVIAASEFQARFELFYANTPAASDNRLQNSYYQGNADHFLEALIEDAKKLKSSDIHIETYDDKCRVRIRVDGLLVLRYLVEKKQYPSLINKIKIAANLDIAEKRLPQDGRIFFRKYNHQFDIRVSIIPTLHGEKVVLRLLSNDATNINLHSLGFSTMDLENYLEGIKKPNGLILISGPTGSGKTTTLYATLKLLNNATRNILTIEDPIEYTLSGINQVQVKENIGLTFSIALRTFLRQDPDVIMLGEIRDAETANMAIRAALTGHLVLSTIHTNSAWGTVSRLIDMGIPQFLIADTLNTSIAQRLIRLLCPSCKQQQEFNPALYPRRYKAPRTVQHHYVAKGCIHCHNTGYKKRKAVYEVIAVDEDIVGEIKNSSSTISSLLKQKQIKTLAENVFDLFEQGETSLDEIYPLLLS